MNRVDRSSRLVAVVLAGGAITCGGPYHSASSDWNDASSGGVDSGGGGVDSGGSGADASGNGVDSGSGGCSATCSTGCCAADGSCVPSTAQDWTNCGAPGSACTTCSKGALCSGGCDNAHWAPNTLLTLTITQLFVTAASCNDTVSTPNPYAVLTFSDPSPARTAATSYCSAPLCEPANNQIPHVQASWLTDGLTNYAAWDHNTLSSDYNCWTGPYPFAAPLAVMATYSVPVNGYPNPGLEFSLTAE